MVFALWLLAALFWRLLCSGEQWLHPGPTLLSYSKASVLNTHSVMACLQSFLTPSSPGSKTGLASVTLLRTSICKDHPKVKRVVKRQLRMDLKHNSITFNISSWTHCGHDSAMLLTANLCPKRFATAFHQASWPSIHHFHLSRLCSKSCATASNRPVFQTPPCFTCCYALSCLQSVDWGPPWLL